MFFWLFNDFKKKIVCITSYVIHFLFTIPELCSFDWDKSYISEKVFRIITPQISKGGELMNNTNLS